MEEAIVEKNSLASVVILSLAVGTYKTILHVHGSNAFKNRMVDDGSKQWNEYKRHMKDFPRELGSYPGAEHMRVLKS